jgi:hypothetical protein
MNRLALLKQIERMATLVTNGIVLFDPLDNTISPNPNLFDTDQPKVLSIGAGTLIIETMLSDTYPGVEITALEPAYIHPKTQHIATQKHIRLIKTDLQHFDS